MLKRRMAVLVAAVVLMAVMGSAVPALAAYYTIGETDDYLRWTGDYDWFSINLSRGVRYCVTLSVPWRSDFDVKIYYNSNGDDHLSDWELVDSGTDGTGDDERVYFTANRSGKYYIKVYSYKGSGYYTLRIKRRY